MTFSKGFAKTAVSMEAARKAFRSRVDRNLAKMVPIHGEEYVRLWARPRAEEAMSKLTTLNSDAQYKYPKTQIKSSLRTWKKALGRLGLNNLGLSPNPRKEPV